MSCYRPLAAYRASEGGITFSAAKGGDTLDLPCGQCIGCRLDRAQCWALRCMHEAALHSQNCFVTLTYDEQSLPPDGSLNHRDFQLFMKRLRFHFNLPVRYYMCGEYGELLSRPHFHACLFNIHFPDQRTYKLNSQQQYVYSSPTLDKLWPHGQSTIGRLTLQSAGYTARYTLTRITGQLADAYYQGKTPEYNKMSNRPGIGRGWFDKYAGTDLLPGDYVVDTKGRKHSVPPYYDKLTRRQAGGLALAEVKAARELRALPQRSDNVPTRLLVKEAVKCAAVRQLKRTL